MNLRGISSIDLQDGCPNRCFACAKHAQRFRPRNTMSPEKLKALSEKITDLKLKGADDLFPAVRGPDYYNDLQVLYEKEDESWPKAEPFVLPLFDSSDPVNYHARDEQGVEWTIYEVADLLHREHGVMMRITTSGWKDGDNFRTRAMERIVARMKSDESFRIHLSYSVKLIGKAARMEHDAFMRSIVGDDVSAMLEDEDGIASYNRLAELHADEFIRSSRYVRRLIDNMRTLKGADVAYAINYVLKSELAVPYRHYRYLFSKEMIKRVVAYAREQSGSGEINEEYVSMAALGRGVRDFGADGHGEHYSEDDIMASEERYDLPPDLDPRRPFAALYRGRQSFVRTRVSQLGWQEDGDSFVDLHRFYVQLNARGDVSIMFGVDAIELRNVAVPEEYFLRRAEHHESLSNGDNDHARMAKSLRMLAGLVGKNVFE